MIGQHDHDLILQEVVQMGIDREDLGAGELDAWIEEHAPQEMTRWILKD